MEEFNVFCEGVNFLASEKKKGNFLDGNVDHTMYVLEEIGELMSELLKLHKSLTKFERGKGVTLDHLVEETGDVWLTGAILISMLGGDIKDILDSCISKVHRTVDIYMEDLN